MGKRALDLTAAILGIVLLGPLLAVLAGAIRLTSRGPAIFAQTRLGRHGRPFRLYKFRSMVADADRCGAHVTAGGDPRVTPLGRLLRRTKLDELPQLWNVLRGDMSLVGPRPEVPEFAELFPAQYRRILGVRPGITHRATLAFRDEERILADAQVEDSRRFYVDWVMPRKLAMYEQWLEDPLLRDVLTIIETVSPWKRTPTVTAGDLLMDTPLVSNVPAWPDRAAAPRMRPQPVHSFSAASRPAVDFADEVEELLGAVEHAR